MKSHLRLHVYFFSFILFISTVYGLGLSGTVTHHIYFEPGHTQEDKFYVSNGERYTSSYRIHAVAWRGADFTEYFTITPEKIADVPPGGSAEFTVKLELPDSFDSPGRHINWVKVDIDTSEGGFRAYPSVAVSYSLFVLYPTIFLQWSLNAPNMNVDEKTNFTIDIENLGEPTIQSIYADIVVYNADTNQTVQTLKTNTATNVLSWDKIQLAATFDSINLNAGDYKAVATLNFDGNIETQEDTFRIGSKNVEILNFTKAFEIDAINKFDIIIESAWNNKIYDIYADIIIYDIKTDTIITEFKSLNTDLNPWKQKTLQAFFDTTGLEKKEYKAITYLKYEGVSTNAEGIIRIDENIGVEIVEEIPGKETQFNLSTIFTLMNLLILLLIIFIIINITLAVGYFKRQPPKPPVKPIDSAVIDHIRELKKKYNNDYIKEMMLKKGWSKDKVKRALKQASKKR